MKYNEVKSIAPGYKVPEAVHEAKFKQFLISYPGFITTHAGKFKTPAWRAFEIAYRQGELDGADTRRVSEKAPTTRPKKSRGRRSTAYSGGGQVGTDRSGEASEDSES